MTASRVHIPPDRLASIFGHPDDPRGPGDTPWVPEAPDGRAPTPLRWWQRGGRHRDPAGPPRVLTVPAGLQAARVRPAAAAVISVVVLALIAGTVLGVRAFLASRQAQPVVVSTNGATPSAGGLVARGTSAAAMGAGSSSGVGATGPAGADGSAVLPVAAGGAAATTGAGGAATPPGIVVVHVVGAVRAAGVVTLPAGSRVTDAVRKAGGATAKADQSAINLARVLVDGEQLVIPTQGDPRTTAGGQGAAGVGASGPGASGTRSGAQTGAPAGVGSRGSASGASGGGGAGGAAGSAGARAGAIDLNTADLAALDGLPGVGPVLAQRILDWRTQHGRFTSVDELGEVSGIGPKALARLVPLVRV